ncbi:DUF4421 family protein [Spirosoma sp. SC4-14]|uniref:DUF4421 family protein n=1 Tax=Spirosoma sp. SC4-14 TaxID=3128900 RepID=UPI0030D2DEA1
MLLTYVIRLSNESFFLLPGGKSGPYQLIGQIVMAPPILHPVRFHKTWLVFGYLLIAISVAGNAQGLRFLGIPLDTLLKTKIPRVDKRFITTYYGRLHLYAVSDRQNYGVRIAGPTYSLHYKPNLAWALGLGIDYRWIGTEITVKLPFLGYNTATKGKTKPFGATFNVNNRRLWISSQYQFYRGFYLANPDALEADWLLHHTTYPYRNDLKSQTINTQVQYLFNPLQLSIPASLLQRERQQKSAGTWIVGGFLIYQYIHADSSFILPHLLTDFPAVSNFSRYRTISLGVDGGYTQTFVLGKYLFTNLTLRPGLSILWQQDNVSSSLASRLRLGWQGVASATIGYSTPRYYGGIYASMTLANRTFGNTLVNTDAEYFRLVFGRRFLYRPKGVIKKLPGM